MKNRGGNSNRSSNKVFRRRPGACTRCRQVKTKCDFSPGEQACQRCKPRGYHCVVEAPKPKVYERERLLTEIRQKDAIIETLLKQLHNPYLATSRSIDEYVKSIPLSDVNNPAVLGLLNRLESSVQIGFGSSSESTGEGDSGAGTRRYANCEYRVLVCSCRAQTRELHAGNLFRSRCVLSLLRFCQVHSRQTHMCPGSRLGNSMKLNYPEILVLGLVTLDDAEQLFDIFYKNINPLVSILDPILHTPKSTLARCPVLFTVICAVASRYHPRKSGIYRIAMHLAKYSAANSLVQDDMKSVELCQAYILMSIYTVPERSRDRDQTWLYTGLAISIATALRLDRTVKVNSVTENEEREYLNRVRVWKLCFLLDQGIAIQAGKPWMMKEDVIIRHSESGEWYRQSLYNLDYDVFLCGYNVLLRIVARFHKETLLSRSGLINSERGNLRDTIIRYDAEIEMFQEEWQKKFKVGGAHHGAILRRRELHFYVAYFRLVMFSFGFHQVFRAGIETWYDYFFTKCLTYAKSVIRCMNEDLAPSGFMRYAPDGQFMCTAFAVVFLFKLLRPEFSYLFDKADKDETIKLIGILINKFSSSDIAVDNRHTPKLYARFLASVLGKYRHSGQDTTFGGLRTYLPEYTDTSTGFRDCVPWYNLYVLGLRKL
ncbi:hypothetical protein EDD18DRAFT_1064935 [Armillaria luteobubalina]|uniref:Zn(2)-C6 fungal-type domain-containing protein n=1 Tax=Armillaria luteobubalina TaxID=153913 RepID=A0AA39V1T0_9AGAR|nr:hypothetical protein EDD18DRAFT_1064935 [Armillaria luteobubalina]